MDGVAASPASEHLFMANKKPKLISECGMQYFHIMKYNLLFLSKRACSNLQ